MPEFTVDTKLFRELGELLVGRESTALIELIKNAYDADATLVEVYGEKLDIPNKGSIVVKDDGVGMNSNEFAAGFLRIAGRSKTGTDRRSPWFRRRYTGEKGIGRLAAHKLAHRLTVESWRWDGNDRDESYGFLAREGVLAKIDWDAIESLETLEEVGSTDAVTVTKQTTRSEARSGTRLQLQRLRREWTHSDLRRFFEEVATLTPPPMIAGPLPPELLVRPPLLSAPKVRDERKGGNFSIIYSGELKLHEEELPIVSEVASWIIEIDCDADNRRLSINVEPTKRFLENNAIAEGFRLSRKLESDEPMVSFQARIFQRENEVWPKAFRGTRVYYEGFRVLPYGDAKDDWLDLDRDYRSRGRGELGRLQRFSRWNLPPGDEKESLVQQGNNQFFGGVFLTREGAKSLAMLINREGFLPSPHFDFISDIVRLGIDLQVRLRYAATSEVKEARRRVSERQKRAASRADAQQPPSAFLLIELQREALAALREARAAIAGGRTREASAKMRDAETAINSASEVSGEAASEATMYRVLASMGLEHAAFVHEVNSLALTAQSVAAALGRLVNQVSPTVRKRVRAIEADVIALRERLRRNAIYLTDVTGVEGRRRRSRQSLHERFEATVKFFETALEKRRVRILNKIPEKVRTPPMFPAEVTAIITNLLSNAVKFAGKGGQVYVSARADDDVVVLRMENTGTAVDLRGAEKWFQPFRSTTFDIDESLGQGMGLGLTITRSLVDEYGGSIEFVPPTDGFSTAIEVGLPQK